VLIDCDTCTVRGQGCDDCVVTVLLGAPPGWGSEPTVVPLTRRRPGVGVGDALGAAGAAASTDAVRSAETVASGGAVAAVGNAPGRALPGREVGRVDTAAEALRPVVELDDVERKAVRALAEFGLVPPLRHQDATTHGDRHVS